MATTRIIWPGVIGLTMALQLAAGGRTPPEPHQPVLGGTPAEVAMIEWAGNRFELAGLVDPGVKVAFGDEADCNGNAGLYEPSQRLASVCNRGEHINQPRQTLLHELTHAWTIDNLSAAEIERWLELEGIDHWFSDDPLAWKRGAERAAEILTWVSRTLLTRTGVSGPQGRAATTWRLRSGLSPPSNPSTATRSSVRNSRPFFAEGRSFTLDENTADSAR